MKNQRVGFHAADQGRVNRIMPERFTVADSLRKDAGLVDDIDFPDDTLEIGHGLILHAMFIEVGENVGLLGISATQAAKGLSLWSLVIFPVLFTAGMALIDTTDSILMVGAYGWAFVNPIRKLWYNLTITAVSVLAAFVVGSIEALQLIAEKLGLEGPFWRTINGLNEGLGMAGIGIIAVCLVCWIGSALFYRWQLAPRSS